MDRTHRRNVRAAALALSLFASAYAQSTVTKPGQPSKTNAPLGQFEIVGDSIVSAQQLFLGTLDKVYIVDKVEANPTKVNGHPAWAAEYSLSKNGGRPMDIVTNSFCAGGTVLGNGTWLNVGGNQAVKKGGDPADSQTGGGDYDDPDGGKSYVQCLISCALINPCDDESCEWTMTAPMTTRRWYPTLETLEDGSAIILGGCDWGGYVNSADQDNPTWEIFPPTDGDVVKSDILSTTLPVNLFPLTWLLPSGKIFLQSNWKTALLDYKAKAETPLDDMLDAVRVYPASGGSTMLPLTPDNNYTATLLFCGGSNLQSDQWKPDWNIAAYNASTSCVRITPDESSSYVQDDPLPEGRSMGNLILLPNGKILMLNGAETGTAGYGTQDWTLNESYADNPVLMPIIYDPSAAKGKRWSRDGLSPSTVPRMYHSGATLLPDGSVFVSGSNPHADYAVDNVKFPTEYRVEYFYPSYYNERRPEPQGILSTLSYGGDYFNVTLTKDDLAGDVNNVKKTKVVVIRTGFSTHAMNMGQRMLELQTSYTGHSDGGATLHVSQLPANPAMFQPGPALVFVVVDGVPSVGVQVMIGSGKLGTQPTTTLAVLPTSQVAAESSDNSTSGDNSAQGSNNGDKNSAGAVYTSIPSLLVAGTISLSLLSSLL
ncbi:copper radical oxidase [Lentinus brumalis]|uniref:Copper radical oxidase n=1 Tax=Lentinus brumalis TaxID=2498619 RepID=A0A371CQZ3_9APHY|nr:copper radical oxidase [Polyporus brumalis]